MKNLIILPFILTLILCVSNPDQNFAYSINYVKSFRPDLISKFIGCEEKSVVYGSYLYPSGPMDALYIYLFPGTYAARFNCPQRDLYVKLFGTAQNYEELLATDPSVVSDKVIREINRMITNYIIDWKYLPSENIQKVRYWLNKFIENLSRQASQVYLKAPASYLCYTTNGLKYLLDLDKVKFYIVEMYGQQAGVYTTYEEIFQKETQRQSKNHMHYDQARCPQFPSYQTLVNNFSQKQFFIEKTIQKEEAGYIGPKINDFLSKAKGVYSKKVFIDSFPEQIIQL